MLLREKKNEKWTLKNAMHVLHFLDQKLVFHKCILLSFSQSIVIHDSRAEVQAA